MQSLMKIPIQQKNILKKR